MLNNFKALCGRLNENKRGLFRLSSVEPLASHWPALAIALWLACAAVIVWQGWWR